ncbi:hypothetical protein EJB05_23448 [Eragrostis curvula]|uniref:Trehalose 6-phosphate phosphatase n=2 Tax=Eragrostis curvula TaxID=38414 RepID=A0A5J9VA58_9POAL|nr:hypothetical protein EJB05_23448 [Eragrostis curvula]
MDLKTSLGSPVIADPLPTLVLPSAVMTFTTPTSFPSPGLYLNTSSKKKPLPGKIEEVRASGWLDLMMASSPTRKRQIKDVVNDVQADDHDLQYCNWMVDYPSALTSFEAITDFAGSKRLALFLDYDGTLSPIVDNPANAIMSDEMRAAVRHVASLFPTAIISGRSRDKVFDFVKLNELYYAGSHGMDIMGPVGKTTESNGVECIRSTDTQGKEVNLFQPASEFLPMIDEVYKRLGESIMDIDGARMEDNKFCVSVHYRNVAEDDYQKVFQRVTAVMEDYPCLKLTHGRKVLEVRPVIDWNKGKAVEFLLESLGLNESEDVLPIYVGDDRTDEDAFKVLKASNRGFGILVSSIPKESDAFYSLRDPAEVMEFLKKLATWKEQST